MLHSYIRGIVYSVFDEKAGPIPGLWFPANIHKDLLDKVASESMALSISSAKVTKQLCHIPLPKFKLKMLVKQFQYSDCNRRGGICDTTLALLFDEVDDLIFYEYVHDFEDIMDKCAMKINSVQEKKGSKNEIQQTINELNDDVESLIQTLYNQEMSQEDSAAFPEAEVETANSEAIQKKFKVIVCGDPNVGKTSLILRFTRNVFKRTYIATLGVNITEKHVKINDRSLMLIFWDVAGQSKFTTVRKQFYKGSYGVILVFDVTDPNSFQNIKKWYKDVKSSIKNINGIIIGNKTDLDDKRKISTQDLKKLSSELHMPTFETSALTGENVELAFEDMAGKFLVPFPPLKEIKHRRSFFSEEKRKGKSEVTNNEEQIPKTLRYEDLKTEDLENKSAVGTNVNPPRTSIIINSAVSPTAPVVDITPVTMTASAMYQNDEAMRTAAAKSFADNELASIMMPSVYGKSEQKDYLDNNEQNQDFETPTIKEIASNKETTSSSPQVDGKFVTKTKPKKFQKEEAPVAPKTNEDFAELQRTEQDVITVIDVKLCIVHKGPIEGANYACPRCNTTYCLHCAATLASNGEGCKSCGSEIEIDRAMAKKILGAFS
ncbi:MAG TPA: GTP-binding protein [Candidatus Lokiarchaeia archaeon]|nr:GTP-binding protein [Candidatus Lokiarchaeia archaeon]